MSKKFGIVLGVVVVGGLLLMGGYFLGATQTVEQAEIVQVAGGSDYKNGTYVLGNMLVTLEDGVNETPTGEDSSGVMTTRYFGNELYKDLDGDGREDVVFLVTQDGGGSGTFFYVVAALNTENGYIGSRGVFLGDRIAPQTIESKEGAQVIVNYADRAVDEPMTTAPSVGKSMSLLFEPSSMQFGEVVADFEGEADPETMTLLMKEWVWQMAEYNDGRTVIPNRPGAFSLTFLSSGEVQVGTDCNNMGGEYEVNEDQITFGQMRSTLMYCEGSQESEFVQLLADTTSYQFTNRGELVLNLKFDSGTVTLK